jgi:hypothetical protein
MLLGRGEVGRGVLVVREFGGILEECLRVVLYGRVGNGSVIKALRFWVLGSIAVDVVERLVHVLDHRRRVGHSGAFSI